MVNLLFKKLEKYGLKFGTYYNTMSWWRFHFYFVKKKQHFHCDISTFKVPVFFFTQVASIES